MSHQVLARTWRPRDFSALIGQEHVVRALTHALETGRIHHAYLFTGTRGVGKTTVSRILARALNCQNGPTPRPCGQCDACVSIEIGRFPDYLELDAASNRGVDEMTQLLEQVVYAPVAGRKKVYMIDEVHMLTGHAFNAMLKTLEEPPAHVVFILATTDPRKVPMTVLSRCLQFNLKNLPPALIARHLAEVVQAESVPAESTALLRLGRAAAGSMRDALSLLEQAIAHGGGRIQDDQVRDMLGAVDRRDLERLLSALHGGDGPALIAVADDMQSANAPFSRALQDFAASLQRIALAQIGVLPDDPEEAESAGRWAASLAPEDLQAWYQIALYGGRDLHLAPDEHAGFTMTLVRMLAFRMAGVPSAVTASGGAAPPLASPPRVAPVSLGTGPRGSVHPVPQAPSARPAAALQQAPLERGQVALQHAPSERPAVPPSPASPEARTFDGDWPGLAKALTASMPRAGLVGQFMAQSELLSAQGLSFHVRVPVKPLAEPTLVGKVREALARYLGGPVQVRVEVGAVQGTTAAAVIHQEQVQAQAQARTDIEQDAFVQTLIQGFDATILPGSIQPLTPPSSGEPSP